VYTVTVNAGIPWLYSVEATFLLYFCIRCSRYNCW